ncbi:hypothetical protein BCR41DRAFT_375126 [Lobosporangium transversale]|uniref:Uncharacterized protein n=1 Tax=Lobosporangium transversale TaxID=64571 RepID=A0A1Y2G9F6_9FUNG|nr:hypothetical protein BCR41DRAFT_375126 [Lobosporangium transversale]ORZ02039.1 hypothetical protein BCR41DRAFT_375126 [Lobosporangium transversale]|eukprot:XP_021876267.1 hypothetical protein BCR41DRAFT_375126 [Lobosporangium transversale]
MSKRVAKDPHVHTLPFPIYFTASYIYVNLAFIYDLGEVKIAKNKSLKNAHVRMKPLIMFLGEGRSLFISIHFSYIDPLRPGRVFHEHVNQPTQAALGITSNFMNPSPASPNCLNKCFARSCPILQSQSGTHDNNGICRKSRRLGM